MFIILHNFIISLLKEEELENNLIKKVFINRFEDILNVEKSNQVNSIMQEELKKYLNNSNYFNGEKDLPKPKKKNNSDFIKNLKIKTVDISGIKGIPERNKCNNYDQSCRYSNKPYLDISKNHNIISLFGFNGDGKSSFTEALEFALTDDVREARRRRFTKSKVSSYIKNINAENGHITIKLIDYENNNKKIKFTRKSEHTYEIEKNDFDDESKVINTLEKEMDKIFIEKNRIDDFALSKDKSQIELYGELLGFAEINNFIKNSWRSYKSEKNKAFYKKKESAKKRFEKIQKQKSNNNTVVFNEDEKNILKIILNKKSLIDLDNILENKKLDFFENKLKTYYNDVKSKKEKLTHLKEAKKLYDELNELLEKIKEIKLNIADFVTDKKIDENIFALYKKANELFEKNNNLNDCPLCNSSNKSVNKIKDEVEEYLLNAKKLTKYKEELNVKKKEKSQIKIKLKNILENLDFQLSEANKDNKFFEKKIKKFKYEKCDQYNDILSKINETKKKIEQFYQKRKKDNELLNEIKKSKENEDKYNEKINLILEDIKEFESTMENFYQHFITEILSEISDHIKEYYNKIVIDNKIKSLNFRTSSGIVLETDFKDLSGEVNNYRKILSEGQLKCFGLSILLALHKNSKLSILILDDIINAVDIDHRKNMINLIIEESRNNKQIIITTYDKLFQEKLVNLASDKAVSYHFNKEFILENKKVDFGKIITRAVEKNDCRTALLYMRIALENTVYHLAESNEIDVPFKDEMRKYKLSLILKSLSNSTRIPQKIKDILKNLEEGYNYSLLNQEAHFWTETAYSVDHQTLEELAEQVIAINKMKDFNEDDFNKLKELKSKDIGDINLNSKEELISKGIICLNNEEYEYTNKWCQINNFI